MRSTMKITPSLISFRLFLGRRPLGGTGVRVRLFKNKRNFQSNIHQIFDNRSLICLLTFYVKQNTSYSDQRHVLICLFRSRFVFYQVFVFQLIDQYNENIHSSVTRTRDGVRCSVY